MSKVKKESKDIGHLDITGLDCPERTRALVCDFERTNCNIRACMRPIHVINVRVGVLNNFWSKIEINYIDYVDTNRATLIYF